MSLWNDLIGRLGYTRLSNGRHFYRLLKGTATYKNDELMQLALNNAITYACIEIRAKMLSQAEFFVENSNGERTKDHKIIELINNPNRIQSKEDFLKQYEWFKSVFGFVYQKPYGATGMETVAIFNLNPAYVEFPKEKSSMLVWSDEDIKKYMAQKFKYKEPKQDVKNILYEDIIPFYDTANGLFVDEQNYNPITSPSRLVSALKSIWNTDLALQAETVMIQTNGRELFSGGAERGFNLGASLPMAEDDKQSIESNLINDYGMTGFKKRAIATNQAITWQSLHIKLKDLGLHESISNNANLIREVFEVPNELYKSFQKGSTYENQKEALITFIQSTIQPIANDLANSWTDYFKLSDSNEKIVSDFSHIPVMQHTEEKKAEKVLKIATAFQRLVQAEMTPESARQFLEAQGVNFIDED